MKKQIKLIDLNKIDNTFINDFSKFVTLKERLAIYKNLIDNQINFDDEEKILRNIWKSIIKRKTSWGTTQIEKTDISITEKYMSSFTTERNFLKNKDLDDVEKNYIIEADNIIKFINSKEWNEDPLSINFLKTMHKNIFKDTLGIFSGKFKNNNNSVDFANPSNNFIEEVIFLEPNKVEEEINKLIFFLSRKDIEPILKAIVCHIQLVFIHPFKDGNGRSARLYSAKILEYFTGIFLPIDDVLINLTSTSLEHNKREYIYVLNQISFNGSLKEEISNYFIQKFLEQINKNFDLFENVRVNIKKLKNIFEKNKFPKKYQESTISLLTSQLLVTVKKYMFFTDNQYDRRTIEKLIKKLIDLNILVKEESTGKEISYKVVI